MNTESSVIAHLNPFQYKQMSEEEDPDEGSKRAKITSTEGDVLDISRSEYVDTHSQQDTMRDFKKLQRDSEIMMHNESREGL